MQPLSPEEEKSIKSWSWGGFFGGWIFLFVNKIYGLGALYLVLFLVLLCTSFSNLFSVFGMTTGFKLPPILLALVGLVRLGLWIYLGIKGRQMAWAKGGYASFADFKKKQKMVTALIVIEIVALIILEMIAGVSLVHKLATSTPAQQQATMADIAYMRVSQQNPNLNKTDFMTGFNLGNTDGVMTTVPASSVATMKTESDAKNDSFIEGYGTGFGYACMTKYNDKPGCTQKLMSAFQSIQ